MDRTTENHENNYMLETTLRALDPELHRRFTDTVCVLQEMLFRFRRLFPEYTDHSALHSLTVIDFCNQLIGPDQIRQMNADSIYILLMASYLHDVGMGISLDLYREFCSQVDFGDYHEKHPDAGIKTIIRDFHQDFSAAFVRKYAAMLEIPSAAHEWAIEQVCRGHRKTDLFDTAAYPPHYVVPGGHEVYLPYLSAMIRLADEIDVSAARNPGMLYDIESFFNTIDISFHKRHKAVRDMRITDDAFVLMVAHIDRQTDDMVASMVEKMDQTLQYCREAARAGSPFRISQKRIEIREADE